MRDEKQHEDMEKAWRQLVRWLISDVPGRVDLAVAPDKQAGDQAVKFRIKIRDRSFRPLDNVTPNLSVTTPAGETIQLAVQADESESGVFLAAFTAREAGPYKGAVEAIVNEETFRASAGWTADPGAEEFKSIQPNLALLETIARETGGEIIRPDSLDRFVTDLPNRRLPVTETSTFPLWHEPAVFAFALACLIGEWGLRRRKGLP
jgi:hypothetical protein